ncbi:MFS transporter [Kineococcus sp. GCM10028916]|uniref:MFS transporter n=1 Tax=Kineococcus sp. GCM10028916 TaxID=3273394 RepID=UPI0036411BF7
MRTPETPTAPTAPATRGATVVLLVGLLLVACAMRAPITGVGSVLPIVSDDLALSATLAGALTSLPLLAFAASSLVVPRVAARLGTRLTLVLALFLLVAGSLLRWVPGVVPLFAGTAVLGVAIGVANVLMPALIRAEFPGRIPLLTSTYVVLMQVVASVSSGVAVPLSEHLAGGWRSALVVWAAPALVCAVLWLPLVRRGSGPATGGPRPRAPWGSGLAWAVTAFMAAQSVIFYVMLAWLATMVHDRSGTDRAAAGVLLSVMQVAGVVGSLLVPVVAGRTVVRTRRAAMGATTFTITGLLLLLLVPDAAVVAVVVAGLGMGGAVVLALASVSARAADGATAVALSGMAQGVGYLAAAVGPVLIGALHVASGSWTVPLVVLVLVAAGQLVAARAAGKDAFVRV